jgi:glycosyltransferase involved in cell wall biosynthesis
MKVVFLLDWHLYYAVELANALARDHEILFVTRDHNYEVSSSADPVSLENFLGQTLDRNIRRDKMRFKRSDVRNFFEIRRLSRVLSRFDPDVLHIQETVDWRIIALASLSKKSKIVITVHDVVSHVGRSRGFQGLFWRRLLGLASDVIVHGQYLKRQFISLYPDLAKKLRIAVIPHGAYSIYKTWDTDGVAEEENTILFFGYISKYKGIEILLKAAPLIAEKVPNTKIIIAGLGDFGPYQSLISNKIRFEIANRFISNREVPRLFRRASVVVLPYIEASQSGVVPVAYAFGKPVIVTDVGSIPEVVEDGQTGFVVAPKSPQALAAAIIKVLQDQGLRKAMGERALAKSTGELSWDAIAKRTSEIYSGK